MFRPTDPLLRPNLNRAITDECDDRLLLNPGRIFVARSDDPVAERRDHRDNRELFAVVA